MCHDWERRYIDPLLRCSGSVWDQVSHAVSITVDTYASQTEPFVSIRMLNRFPVLDLSPLQRIEAIRKGKNARTQSFRLHFVVQVCNRWMGICGGRRYLGLRERRQEHFICDKVGPVPDRRKTPFRRWRLRMRMWSGPCCAGSTWNVNLVHKVWSPKDFTSRKRGSVLPVERSSGTKWVVRGLSSIKKIKT